MLISYNEFINALLQWANNKSADFRYYWPLKGGWESWTQAEIAAFILSVDSTSDVLREQHVYTNNNLSADLLINANLTTNQQQIIVVEMKCQSFQNHANFLAGIDADILKMHRANLVPGLRYAQLCVLGIYFDQQARDGLLARGFFEFYQYGEIGCAAKLLV